MKLLKSEFGANLADAVDALMLPPSVQDARTLHEAMKVGFFLLKVLNVFEKGLWLIIASLASFDSHFVFKRLE